MNQQQQEIPETFNIIERTNSSTECTILAHVVSDAYNRVENNRNLQLLSGIVEQELAADILRLSSFRIKKNEATVIIHFDSHAECEVTSDDVDLLLLFLPVNGDELHNSFAEKIRNITETRGESIWNHTIIILTGFDTALHYNGGGEARLTRMLARWTNQLQQNIESRMVKILPAGRQDQSDLPKPHQKWFSKLCFESFRSLKVRAMPAMLKFAQGRVSNSIRSREIQRLPFHQQPIEVKENSVELPTSLRVGLGIGGGGAIAGATAAGATTGALIGALAIGIPSFGIAAGLGLLIGGIVGGGVGGGIASAAVGGAYKAAKNQAEKEISALDLKIYYSSLLTRIPKISTFLTKWARKQTNCRIVVTGIAEEGASTVAAALVGQNPSTYTETYQSSMGTRGTLTIHDFPSCNRHDAGRVTSARQLVEFARQKNAIVLCIPMTALRQNFPRSPHGQYLQQMCSVDRNILSNIAIALTDAHNVRPAERGHRNNSPRVSTQEFFSNELREWKTQIQTFLAQCNRLNEFDVTDVPIIPVGSRGSSIDLSDNGQGSPATQYHWHSEFFLQIMPAIKLEGIPTLIRINRRRVQQQPNEYSDLDRAHELIVGAQCSMFSRIGLNERGNPGQAIGLILGTKEQQNW